MNIDEIARDNEAGGGKLDDDNTSSESESDNEEDSYVMSEYKQITSYCCNANIVIVSAVIVADGSEEVAVFLPLLAANNYQHSYDSGTSLSNTSFWIILLFYSLILLQCCIAYALVHLGRHSFDSSGRWHRR